MRRFLGFIFAASLAGCAGPNMLVKTEYKDFVEELGSAEKQIVQIRPAMNNSLLLMQRDGRLTFWTPQKGAQQDICKTVSPSGIPQISLGNPVVRDEYFLWDVSDDGEYIAYADPESGVVVRSLSNLSLTPVIALPKDKLKPKPLISGLRVSNGGRSIAFIEPQPQWLYQVAIKDTASDRTGYLAVPFVYTGSADLTSVTTDKEFDWPFIGGFSADGSVLLVSRSRNESVSTVNDSTYKEAKNYLYEDFFFYDIPTGKTYASIASMDEFRRSRMAHDFIVCTECLIISAETRLSTLKFSKGFLLPETEIPEGWEKTHPELLKRPGFFKALTASSLAELRKGPGYVSPDQLVKDPNADAQVLAAAKAALNPGPYGWTSRYSSIGNQASLITPFELLLSPDGRNYLMKFYWRKFTGYGLSNDCFFGTTGRQKVLELRDATGCAFSQDGKYVYSAKGNSFYRAPVERLAQAVPATAGDSEELAAALTKLKAEAPGPSGMRDIPVEPAPAQPAAEPADAEEPEQAGDEEGNDPEAALKSAKGYAAAKDYMKALEEYERALSLLTQDDPRRVYVLGRRGELFLKRKDFAKAKKTYLDAIQTAKQLKIQGNDPANAYSGFAYCLEKEGNVAGAVRNYKKALGLATSVAIRKRIKKRLDRFSSASE